MQTRRAASTEEKLRATLKELESAKNLCSELLRERDDSEIEVKKIIDKNTSLKNELSDLHISHSEVLEEHQNLRRLVAEFQRCMDTHEQALKRIAELELELSVAHKSLASMQLAKFQEQSATTCSLFEELVDSGSMLICNENPVNTVTIDLTEDVSLIENPTFKSHNKLKKYIKVNKIIKKHRKSLHTLNISRNNNNYLRKKLVNLNSELQALNRQQDQSRIMYDQDIAILQEQLESRECTLQDIFHKYEASQKELSERMVEAGELVDLVRYNAERYESLTNNLCCACSCSPPTASVKSQSAEPLPVFTTPALKKVNLKIKKNNNIIRTHIFSDKLGQGLGSIICSCSQQSVLNTCLPGASFYKVSRQIALSEFNAGSTGILLFGDGLAVSRADIIDCIDLMLQLCEKKKCKFIFCALPYSNSLTYEQNMHIYNLNLLIYNITCYNKNSIMYFDINKFSRSFKLTQYSMYLSSACKRRIAKLLAYNIPDSGTNVPKGFDNISNCTNNLYTSSCLNSKAGQRGGCMD